MTKHIVFSLTVLLCLSILVGCADRTDTEPQKPVVPREPKENVAYEDASQFHSFVPSVLEFVLPRTVGPVSEEEFMEYGPVSGDEASLWCVTRTARSEGDRVTLGLFYPDDDGTLHKVCTNEACRLDPERPCEHLSAHAPLTNSAIRFGDAVYFIGTLSDWTEESKDIRYAVLEWKIGAPEFDKLFETDRILWSLHGANGILYVFSPLSYAGDENVCYAIRMDREIAVEIPMGDALLRFGEEGAVRIGAGGVESLDFLLRPERTILTERHLGAVGGRYFWYIEGGSLRRVSLDRPGNSEKILDGVAAFRVSGNMLWYVTGDARDRTALFSCPLVHVDSGVRTPTGEQRDYLGWRTQELWSAVWKRDGSLSKTKRLFSPSGDEWLDALDWDEGLHPPVRGDILVWRTVSPGEGPLDRELCRTYLTAGGTTAEIGFEAVPAGEN